MKKFGSAPAGLSAAEAAKRLAADGPNELKEGTLISPLQIFLGQFNSLITWILIVAGVISGTLGEVVDASAILAIVVLNAVIGFYQEFSAGVSFAVFFHSLQTQPLEVARTHAFTVLVFAELLRALGARSETKRVWRISLLTTLQLPLVVAVSFGLQLWSQHNATLGRWLKTSALPITDCLTLLAVGAIPLVVLEIVKLIRRSSSPQ